MAGRSRSGSKVGRRVGERGGARVRPPKAAGSLDAAGIDRVIRRHLGAFRKPGVLTVRPGFEIAGGRITGRPAIVVTVARKRARVPATQQLPDEIQGIPVDVRQSTPLQRLRARNPTHHAMVARYGRSEVREPEWPLERRVSDGKRLATLPKPVHPAAHADLKKPEIPYTPARVPLKPVTGKMTVLACASPDAGFTVLADFLKAVRSRLTVGLYDFTSGDILATLRQVLEKDDKSFCMVLDHPAPNPTANQSDEQTVATLRRADKRAKIDWALTRTDPEVAKWIFPSAYHIKVAVRDSAAFWLSSGNWNVSNQPNFAAKQASRGAYDTADRDWHLVVMHEGLARLFEAYIEHDFQVAGGEQTKGSRALHTAIKTATAAHQREQKAQPRAASSTPRVPFTLGKPQVFTNAQLTIQPLLTPDKGRLTSMYVDHVLALITSARRRLYMQTQYIHPSDEPGDRNFMRLVDACAEAVRRRVDVRLILSQYENTPQYIELLHKAGLSGVLRIQDRVHNKGIVVDSGTVLVSSQNWSGDGTLRNRDAGVIIRHAGIARYFEQIFLEDWEKRADVRVK